MRDSRTDEAGSRRFPAPSPPEASASLELAPPPALGAALAPRYAIVRTLGRGGSAVVYLAHDHERGVDVALKVLHEELSSLVSTTRFLREVAIARRLEHPHIAPVFDSGSAAGRTWYTMPYIAGRSLRDRLLRERQLSLDETFTIARQLAAALDHAHAGGIVHRDVKPANILLAPQGAILADFGVARAMVVASRDSLTDSGFALGTPEYMSPEQAAAEHDLDGRCDVYALGCVVYHMLAGEPPFTGPSAQAVIARHFAEPPRSLRVVRPAVPPTVERAINRALEKVPADRFATAGDFVAALTARPDAAATATPARPPSRTGRRALAVAGGVLLLAAAAFGGVRQWLGAEGTTSLRAHRAFGAGQQAMRDGHFARADSQFTLATRADPGYARAAIWSALVRWWLDAEQRPSGVTLRDANAQAMARGAPLDPRDSLLLTGLLALADGQDDVACRTWTEPTTRDPLLRYALGTCLRRDPAVLPDSASPSGWRFRTSHERAIVAYEEAFALQPSLMRGHGARSIGMLQELFRTSSARVREGRAAADDTIAFFAFLELDADTLRYVPYPASIHEGRTAPPSLSLAIQHERSRFLRAAQAWSRRFPDDPIAARATAVALDLLGDAAAPEAFERALALAESGDERLRIAAEAVLVRIKHALPDDTAMLRRAVVSADSLLGAHPPSERREVEPLGALAALLGRATLAADYASKDPLAGAAHALKGIAPALLAYASLGGPADSLTHYEQLVEAAVASLPPRDGDAGRAQWLWRAAATAYPQQTLHALTGPFAPDATLLEPIVAAIAGERARVNAELARRGATRATLRPADFMMEGLYAEVACLVAVNEPVRARARLDTALTAIRYTTTLELGRIPRTGALVRAMALRATLAASDGDREGARRWARAVLVLWSGADAFLRPTVAAMERLAD